MLGRWCGASLRHKAESTRDHAAHGNSRLGVRAQRSILHALLDLKGHRLLARRGRDRLIKVRRHDGKKWCAIQGSNL
jgi:hypothetical protein